MLSLTTITSLEQLELVAPFIPQALRLYITAFPTAERRPLKSLFQLLSQAKIEVLFLLDTSLGELAGFSVIHQLPSVTYIEYLCIAPNRRNSGSGTFLLNSLHHKYPNLALEVEPLGTDAYSNKRIAFYKRNGFRLLTTPYLQPPYTPNGSPIALQLMTTSDLNSNTLTQEIHQYVYNCPNPILA